MSHCLSNSTSAADDVSGEIMLFGVRVKVDPMRKSVSMNNLSDYHQPHHDLTNIVAADVAAVAAGYASADDAVPHQSVASRERKRGVPWTEEEHKLFLLGLQKVGKGDWRGISRNFVKTRTPTQVASHAQKYFLRRSNLNRRRRRSSLFDITTDSVTATPMEEEHIRQDNKVMRPALQSTETPKNGGYPVASHPVPVTPAVFPVYPENALVNLTVGNAGQVNNTSTMLFGSIPALPLPESSKAAGNLNQKLTKDDPTLSLNLSLSFDHQNHLSSRHSAYRGFINGDGMISVV